MRRLVCAVCHRDPHAPTEHNAPAHDGAPFPLLAIHGDHDELVPYSTGHTSWEKAKSPKFFMTIIGGKHATEALGGTTPKQRALTKATIDFFDFSLKGDQSAMARLQQVASQPGISKLESQP